MVKIKYNGELEIRKFLEYIGYTTIVTRNGKTEDMHRTFVINIEYEEHMYAVMRFGGEVISPYKY